MSMLPLPDAKQVRAALAAIGGRTAVVVGAAKSGCGAARLLRQRGARVVLIDDKPLSALAGAVEQLQPLGVEMVGGGIDGARLLAADLIVVSPGVPLARPEIAAARQRGVLAIGEVDVALSQLPLPLVAITGTNGKSTTTTMVGSLLQAAGNQPFVGGNLGQPLSDAVGSGCRSLVVELSSYQLEIASLLEPRAAIITNLTPDHLDRYPDAEAYYQAKRNVYRTLAEGGAVVARVDELNSGLLQPAAGQRWLTFGRTIGGDGARIVDDAIEVSIANRRNRFEIDNPRVRGEHNRENLAAAILAALAFGSPADDVRRGIAQYQGIAHRLEEVATVGGVLYVNDSKGTNVDAVVKALQAFDRPVLLIAGGRDKGAGYAPLVVPCRDRVRVLLTIGEAAPLIERELEAAVGEVVKAGTLQQAVRDAATRARPGDVVLLSPACASFDQFANFEERGRIFASLVRALPGSGS
jgi:UDP-N-acetylmuramoylalanine--D-glutamate ligase